MPKKTRVAILGGGCAGVSAAFWLTSSDELRNCFEVTLFTHGWRLGGKGASGRNAGDHQRIEEHGLHLFMGFYQNAFQTLKACYEELAPNWNNKFKSVDQAFEALRTVVLTEQIDKGWETWKLDFPESLGKPWDEAVVPSLGWDVARVILGWLKSLVGKFRDENAEMLTATVDPSAPETKHPLSQLVGFLELLDEMIVLAGLREVEKVDNGRLLDRLDSLQRRLAAGEHPFNAGAGGAMSVVLLSVGIALIMGLVKDVLPHGDAGFDSINDRDLKDWLQSSGGLDPKYAWSAPVRSIYDLAFAYENGEYGSEEKAKIAAGAAAKTFLRMSVQYKDAPLWRMKAGMGDVVFAPLYEALHQRKVSIEFFHRVKNLGLSEDKSRIDEITFTRQVDLSNGNYEPLRDVKGLKCWPSEPDWSQILNGDGIKDKGWNLESVDCDLDVQRDRRLCYGSDADGFDAVVLAIPPDSLDYFGKELLQGCPAIRNMRAQTYSVPTQSVQIWRALETPALTDPKGGLIGAYVEPFNTLANMSQLPPLEEWGTQIVGCEYYCGPMRKIVGLVPRNSKAYSDWQDAAVKKSFEGWNNANGPPRISHIPPPPVASQHYHANFDPSELYIQTPPNTVQYRLDPANSGLDNLYLAGDWTLSSINGGSAEAAFESGRRCAQLIAQRFYHAPKQNP